MRPPVLLTRDNFRASVFERDGQKCVFFRSWLCEGSLDAHHIIERRLWPDGGYYIDNGATVCQYHHLECERTTISVEEVRAACSITRAVLPPHLYDDQPYDKWGNPVLPNGQRLRGDLFFDESVQKVLAAGGVLRLFTNQVKYPRTYHLPWSENVTADDRQITTAQASVNFSDRTLIVTEKMDGENTTMYRDYIHARSIDSRTHPSRNWVKQFWSQRAADIPDGWRICGENLYAKHAIYYSELPTYFMGFSVWNERNICLSWEETLEWFQLLNIVPVPVLYKGPFNLKAIHSSWAIAGQKWIPERSEGYVVRVADEFPYSEFRYRAAKYVRKNHVQGVKHWMHGQRIEKNQLKG